MHTLRTTVGCEQEYFLVDKTYYEQRKDLIYTARTLFGAPSPKGQEMEDHYFGTIKTRVQEFMNELNEELWKLGVSAKTEHNEVAPAQHELAPVFTTTNIATDHNQLMMELIQRIAKKHDMVALLHEKPFEGINGSGKHNNWSISTDTGVNLLEPGETPHENAQFLLFLCAVIKAVDEHQDLLRLSVATAGNDHRLGANEAPPAIISMFLGDELTEILEAIEQDRPYDGKAKEVMKIGAHVLPKFQKDTTDRNRTSPFAFTGNKFEFRAAGSSQSCAGPNIILNTIVAAAFDEIATYLESLPKEKFNEGLQEKLHEIVKEHKRVIFNGDGYSEAWIEEAQKRGLPNLRTTPEALKTLLKKENIDLFAKYGVFSSVEMKSRYEVFIEEYERKIHIEAGIAINLAKTMIVPAVSAYLAKLAAANVWKNSKLNEVGEKISALLSEIIEAIEALEAEYAKTNNEAKTLEAMAALRAVVDKAEGEVEDGLWPLPKYSELLFMY